MRLFVALLVSQEMKSALLRTQAALRRQGAEGNFSREENFHLTLAFLGETEDPAGAEAAMEQACRGSGPFRLTLRGGGSFGDSWWAGVDAPPALGELAGRLAGALRDRGFAVPRREFLPHITLIRQVRSPLPLRPETEAASMTVRRVSLMRSERIGGRLIYTEIAGREL